MLEKKMHNARLLGHICKTLLVAREMRLILIVFKFIGILLKTETILHVHVQLRCRDRLL